MGKRLVITEKPSVARDIAAALGGFVDHDEYLEAEDWIVTWAVGHLLELSEPQDYDPQFRSWSIRNLPIIPQQFQLKPREKQKKRLDWIEKLAKRKDVTGLVNACDAGREGELIYRRIVEYCGLGDLPQERLWLQSMTHAAIRDAFANLRRGADLDPLADAAWLRSVGDWLVGMNATRALTQRLKSRGEREAWSAGRVQTPTLYILVAREREILAHVPQPYWEIEASFAHDQGDGHTWTGRYWDPALGTSDDDDDDAQRRPNRLFDRAEVDRLIAALEGKQGGVASEKRKKSKQSPPLLFDLTSLQREANRRFSMSARRTLEAAQRLYEQHKVLTYPRTDSRYLPEDYGPVVDQLLGAASGLGTPDYAELASLAARIRQQGPQNLPKLLDSSKVSDHFAIVPTGNPVPPLSGDDARVFELVLRQFLAALMGPATWATVERIVEIPTGAKPARFRTTARSLEIPGFLEALGQQAGAGTQLPPLAADKDEVAGVAVAFTSFRVEDKETKPPGRYSEAQLLRMMETAGENLEEEELSDAMKDRGLGTPATRADTIERLVETGYARRVAGKLVPSSKAMRLMDVLERVHASGLASPALTGEWEYALNQVALGRRKREDVQNALIDYTRDVTKALTTFEHQQLYANDPPLGKCPQCGSDVVESVWGYRCVKNDTRDGAERLCDFMIWKDRFGRYIDRTLAERLLRERTVGPVEGFVDRSGREMLKGTLTLTKDEERGWVLETKFGAPVPAGEEADAGAEQIIGPSWACPAHEDCRIVETTHRWVCQKVLEGTERNGPLLPKKVCLRDIEPEEAEAYFGETGRTPLLENFISRRGRPFKGMLIRKPTGKHGFEFPEREGRGGRGAAAKGGAAEGEVDDGKVAKGGRKAAAKTTTKRKTAAKGTKSGAAKGAAAKPKGKAKAKGKGKGKAEEAVVDQA